MSGKTKEEIAFDLVSKLKGVGVWGEQNMQQILDMYAECLEATSGLRAVKGGTPSALRLPGQGVAPASAKAAPAPAQAPAPRQAAPQQAAPAQQAAAPQQPPAPQQPQVRQQQQLVQQAFQQQQGQQPR